MTYCVAAPHFIPWRGRLYDTKGFNGLRLLIMGESHYEWDSRPIDCPDERELTHFCVQDNQHERPHRFWKRATRLLLPDDPLPDPAVWDQVCYFNFVQTLLADSQKRPERAMWRASAEPFLHVVAELEPECILVLGKMTWMNMPGGLPAPPILAGVELRPARRYPVRNRRAALASYVNHPSWRRFRLERWLPVAESLLERARRAA